MLQRLGKLGAGALPTPGRGTLAKEPPSAHQLLHMSLSPHAGDARGVAAAEKLGRSEVEQDVRPKHGLPWDL
ncbi:hypothetical protein I79_018874 [Cricetulus griseus]|uniref:Uncharacterized protein n=1 Tax=Cricetulus griseus TaxID=10029 RepID=G3I5W4_CRIGR|nr:hypothetical protein I79_018874 [Cricetulus griseus]